MGRTGARESSAGAVSTRCGARAPSHTATATATAAQAKGDDVGNVSTAHWQRVQISWLMAGGAPRSPGKRASGAMRAVRGEACQRKSIASIGLRRRSEVAPRWVRLNVTCGVFAT